MSGKLWKQVLYLAGLGIGITGVVFVFIRLRTFSAQIDLHSFTCKSYLIIAGLSFSYCFSNFFLAFAWRELLLFQGTRTTIRWAIRTYGISQLGKYLPGNVFQFAGRQAIGQAKGIQAVPLAKSAVWEIGLLAFSGIFFAALVIPYFLPQVKYYQVALLFFALVAVTLTGLKKWQGKRVEFAMKWYLTFLLLSGLFFFFVLHSLTSIDKNVDYNIIGITGAYVVAWLAGLLTPGAPAGIGVRELVFIFLLRTVIPEDELLKAIIISRFVTVTGDVLFYLVALTLELNARRLHRSFTAKIPIR